MQEKGQKVKKIGARIEWPADVHGYLLDTQADIQKDTHKKVALPEVAFRILRAHRDKDDSKIFKP